MATSTPQTLLSDTQQIPPVTKTETTTTTITAGTITTIVTTTTTTTVIDASTKGTDGKAKRPLGPEVEVSSNKQARWSDPFDRQDDRSRGGFASPGDSIVKELDTKIKSHSQGRFTTAKAYKDVYGDDSDSDGEEVEGLKEQGKILICIESMGGDDSQSFLVTPDTTFDHVQRKWATMHGRCPASIRLLRDGRRVSSVGYTPRDAHMKVGRKYTLEVVFEQVVGILIPQISLLLSNRA
ncbi:hypothetical protein I302_106942 [Kwoniella bestiolae CBS 10118]|uniref:Ubiquitin-like domain-containing protein n=1 Tax=Kwoniella bestiolae CBS 10118 TaxID=1296100 RepID=A0AAJ8KC48_9TREE